MSQHSFSNPQAAEPELPPDDYCTPALVIFEERVLHNLRQTAQAAGGMHRLMPHLKTHRAPWIVRLLIENGVTAFKGSTVAEIEMAVEAGASKVLLSYPTASRNNILRFLACTRKNPEVEFSTLVDTPEAAEIWKKELTSSDTNVGLRVDLDPGLGRTGLLPGDKALDLARSIAEFAKFVGWHVYDGNVKGSVDERRGQVEALAAKVRDLNAKLAAEGIDADTVAGGSYTFDLWPEDVAAFVSPGSWTYSSAQHDIELQHLQWLPAAFVLTTVVSSRPGTMTLDAGCKAISPDKPLAERFRWDGAIRLMNEEHTVVSGESLAGQRLLLIPQHACTTAYMYDVAIVKTVSGTWETRPQLGSKR